MVETLNLKEENKIRKIAETRMAVYIYIYIYIVYCHLENKKTNLEVTGYKFEYNFVKFNNKIKDRTILKVDMDKNIKNILKSSYFISIGLSFCAFHYKGKRAGP